MAANLSLKIFVAGAVLMLGLNAPAFAAPRDQECTDCPISNKYDSEEVVEKIKRIKKTLANEEPIDGAIVVLDGGLRSEQARKGRYRFDAVRSGAHRVKLLIESLPDGAAITGDADVPATLSRGALSADVTFVVSVEKRPEIRRVFPPRGGSGQAAATARPATGRRR